MTDREGAELACELAFGQAAFGHRSRRCLALLDEGVALPQALQQTGMITGGDSRLLSLARRSGQGEQALEFLARKLVEQGEEALERTVGRIEPTVVRIRTDLKTGFARFLLANSITLTPGTLTVESEGPVLTVHCIRPALLENTESSAIVRLLRKMEA
jgi:hypothetical protein